VVKKFLLALGDRKGEQVPTGELLKRSQEERERRRMLREDEEDDARHRAKMAELRKNESLNSAAVEKVSSGDIAKSPVQIEGKFNLGEYNFQEAQRQAEERATRAAEAESKRAAEAEERARQAEDRAHKAEMDGLRDMFTSQLNQLNEQVKSGMTQKSFLDQYEEIKKTAEALGTKLGGFGDSSSPTLQLETLRIQQEMAREERKFDREMKESDRAWEMKLRESDRASMVAMEELKIKREQLSLLANMPKVIGHSVGQALAEKMEGGGGSTPDGVISKKAAAPAAPSEFHLEAGEGETGEFECPQCKTMIAIGPTTTMATCVGCKSRYPIIRTSNTKVTVEQSTPAGGGYEEDE